MIYALLTGKTEEMYVALLRFICHILPLGWVNVSIFTDFELAQINAIFVVFPESTYQGCYFHFCQVTNLQI